MKQDIAAPVNNYHINKNMIVLQRHIEEHPLGGLTLEII